MAEKYCDQGLYGAASVTGHIHNTTSTTYSGTAGTTLVVTAVASGTISLGSVITGTGIPAYTYVTAYQGTAGGGLGAYTVAQGAGGNMAVPSTTITGAHGNCSLIPRWGVAQDGDGTALAAATPATASIVFTGIPTGTISVMGQTLAPSWVTSASVCADNLATAINASTLTAGSPASFKVKSQIRNHIYARGPTLGAPANTCEIMTRQGSADHAGLAIVAHTLTNVSTASPVLLSGGSGGAWGWLCSVNGTTLPSAIARESYGLWTASLPYTGSLDPGDIVRCRSAKTIYFVTNPNGGPGQAVMGTVTNPVRFVIDDSTTWADGANPVLKFIYIPNLSGTVWPFSLGLNTATYSTIEAPNNPATDYYGLIIEGAYGASGTGVQAVGFGPRHISGIEVRNGAGLMVGQIFSCTNSIHRGRLNNCKAVLNSQAVGYGPTASAAGVHLVENLRIVQGISSSSHPGVIAAGANSGGMEVYIDNLSCEGFSVGSKLFPTTVYTGRKFIVRNPTLGNVTDFGGKVCTLASPAGDAGFESVSISDIKSGNAFVLDKRHGFSEWNPKRDFPALNATRLDGKKLSIRAFPTTATGIISKNTPFTLPSFTKVNTLADGARTFRFEFCVKDTPGAGVVFNKATVWFRVTYVDTGGSTQVVDTYDESAGSFTASTNTWVNSESGATQELAGQVTWNDTGSLYFNKYYVTVSTLSGYDLKIGTVMSVDTFLAYTAVTPTDMVFIDPDVGIS